MGLCLKCCFREYSIFFPEHGRDFTAAYDRRTNHLFCVPVWPTHVSLLHNGRVLCSQQDRFAPGDDDGVFVVGRQ